MSTGTAYLNQFQYTYEKDSVTMYGSFEVDGSGEVVHFQGGGIESVSKLATGTYQIQLMQGWNYLLDFGASVISDAYSDINSVQLEMNPATLTQDVKDKLPLQIVCLANGVVTDPLDTASVRFRVVVRRSQVGPFDAGTTV